ncbi:MAG: PaaI family thioesterase [Burkholderiales bacterium]|nr:PaaI family thioesterase [Burkholderiales bacterium]
MTQRDPPRAAAAAPPGFKLLNSGPTDMFVGINGPIFRAREGDHLIVGMRVERRHCNPGETCHGGMLMTFVDMAMVMAMHYQGKLAHFMHTVSLTTDFLASAPLGSWIQARTDILRVTRKLVFAQCLVTADGTAAVRASGVFKIGPALKRADADSGT